MEFTETENTLTGGEEQNFDISSDLIRGHINTIILRSLYDGDKYGYDIINEIENKSGGLYTLKQPTLYSALKRLESLKYVESYYGDYSNGGRRKYFSLTDKGRAVTEKNLSEWEYSRTIIDSLISDGNAHYDFSFITDKQTELTEKSEALKVEQEAFEETRAALEEKQAELTEQKEAFLSEKAALQEAKIAFEERQKEFDKKNYELTEKEYSLQEKLREADEKSTQSLAESEEVERQRRDFLEKQAALNEENARLQTEISSLRQREQELVERQELYNQQQMEFMSRKNSLASQQFDFAEKLTSYNSQLKKFSEDREEFEQEQTAIREERRTLQDKLHEIEKTSAELASKVEAFEKEKAEFGAMRESVEKTNDQTALNLHNRAEELDRKAAELQRREITLEAREEAFNAAKSEFGLRGFSANQAQSQAPRMHNTPFTPTGYSPIATQSAPAQQPAPPIQPQASTVINFDDMHNRANGEGIRLKTAGTLHGIAAGMEQPTRKENVSSLFNKGFTLFKAAMVIFCFILAEALAVFFLRDVINVPALYPAIPFAIGFAFFIVCAILYACGYRSQERRSKNSSYLVSAVIIFVITVIATSMVAIYFKADLTNAMELLKFIVLPVVFLLNIVLFAIFYHLFSRHTAAEN